MQFTTKINSRYYTELADTETKNFLDKLADKSTSPEAYRSVMFNLGVKLGNSILRSINSQSNVYVACTVEDADFLAKGILTTLEPKVSKLAFACFWNQRFSPFEINELKVAPILKKYQEPVNNDIVQYLIVIKSIISGACVVRTNLTNLIQKIEPEKIIIAAPVIYKTAEEKLSSEFNKDIYSKFEFFYFAKDSTRDDKGIVLPGIGGSVYERLGFEGQDEKNRYIPEIVKSRRHKLIQKI